MNQVTLFGNVGKQEHVRLFAARDAGGQSMLSIPLCTTRKYLTRDGDEREETEWFNVVVYGRRADALHPMIKQGKRLFVAGRIKSYKDKDDEQRIQVVAEVIEFGESAPRNDRDARPNGARSNGNARPQQNGARSNRHRDDFAGDPAEEFRR